MKRILLFLAIGGTLPSASLVSSSCGSIVSKGPDTLIINTTNPGLEDGGQSQKNAPKPIVAACGNNSPKTTMTQTTTPNPENATRAQQLLDNPKAEICAFVDGEWIRIAGELIADERIGAKKDMLDNNPNQGEGHNLMPSPLPQMERTEQPLTGSITIPANSKKEILLDNKVLTNAYFNMRFSGGAGSCVKIGYAEALYFPDPSWQRPSDEQIARIPAEYQSFAPAPRTPGKGNRDETEGKLFIGRKKSLLE